jgi:two-component system sensor kinase FixL
MKLAKILAAHAKALRSTALAGSAILIVAIALADLSRLSGGRSLGFLYLLPVLIAATQLKRKQIFALAALCTLLRQALGPLAWDEGAVGNGLIGLLAFGGAGLFVTELAERRRRRLEQKRKLEEQATLRQDAEQQLRVLTETSPAAILTIDTKGRIMLANQAAHNMLGFGQDPLCGEPVGQYLPPLASVPQADSAGRILRTTLECKGRRRNGEIFPAHIWLSSFTTVSGPMLAAIVLDTSEELRDREALGFDQLMRSSRILVRAVSHEIRNLCAAIAVLHTNLRRVPGIEHNEDFQALGTLVEGLGKLVATELRSASQKTPAEVNLREVLEELRIIIEPSFAEEEAVLRWMIPEHLPPVSADHHGLLHIFMNLATNSQRALRSSEDKRLIIAASVEQDKVVVRFADSGPGVERPEHLFQPFRHPSDGAGLGLYLSRALARSFAGELVYEPQPYGSCFAVELPLARQSQAAPQPE